MIGVVPDPVLGPLLERLAVLEAANYRLRSGLSDRHFNAEVENAALREQLAGAKEEVARHQALCESLACELLAAAQARDRAQAAAEENAKTRAQAVSERDGLRVELDALKAIVEEDKGLKTRAALVA
ncbi:MAG: hypothetical protein HY403_02330, partial [Elusimicrobia bacterium]|nr:hypothetical protein [Elusimicrobiota bacterium]